jgi:Zn-dependent M16 (insulinase) family peptidase
MTQIHGFELLQEQDIHELNAHGYLYRHKKTGAELLSLTNNDENKVFGITFRTPPHDSTGLPHIMEHSVLCGSRKYPVKEPFVELMKGSLNTFLNAFTYPDRTCYPVASQNLKDFYNLIDVYMDAVFYPLIPPQVLQQEGWHYELDNLESPLAFKGVVFNEMKGAYSSPDSLIARYSQRSLFPDNAYGLDSGGDPRSIPDLTYSQFKSFHDTYYHPSNARIFFYGDDDPEERLRLMDGCLDEFRAAQVDSAVRLQPEFNQPKRLEFPYDAGGAGDEGGSKRKAWLTVNWLLPEITRPQTRLGLQILSYILIGTPASPLRKALIDSGLGEDITGGGLESELRQMFFSTGLKGLVVDSDGRLQDADRVESLILEVITTLAQEGIDPEMVEAAVNTIEFRLRENNTGSFPRGLSLMLRALTTWLYDRDPFSALSFEEPLRTIQESLGGGEPYFEDLIRKFLLDNPNRTTVILRPDPEYASREDQAEKDRLAQTRAGMTSAELQEVLEDSRQLKLRQETPDPPEALAAIPALKLDDLEKEVKRIPLDVQELESTQVLYHDLFTNGILYLDAGFNLGVLPQEYLPYVSLFGRAFVELGTEAEDYVKLSQRIGRKTGGIRPASFTSAVRGRDQGAAWLFLRGKSTLSQAEDLLGILRDILLSLRLDNQSRFRQMVLEEKADQEAQIIPVGHRMINSRLRASFDVSGWAAEQMGGISYLFFLRQLAEDVDRDWPGVLEKLETMRSILVNRSGMLCNVTLDSAAWKKFKPSLQDFLQRLPLEPLAQVEWNPSPLPSAEGLTIPAQVNYVGKGANLYRLGYHLHGSIYVILNYLRSTWLWEQVRVRGGAYGAFCPFDQRSGVFTFISYRDPNLKSTLDIYDQTGQFLKTTGGARLSADELTKSIIGAIGDMDAYQLPDAKGYTSMQRYLAGEDDEHRQILRNQILSTGLLDFSSLGEVLEAVKDTGRVVVLGSQEAVQAANSTHPGWLEVRKVL